MVLWIKKVYLGWRGLKITRWVRVLLASFASNKLPFNARMFMEIFS